MNEILLLVLILAVFLAPALLTMRRQQKQIREIESVQSSIVAGDRVVTSSGVHGSVQAMGENTIDLEIAPGVVTTWDKRAIVRVDKP